MIKKKQFNPAALAQKAEGEEKKRPRERPESGCRR
jgi:hypothetical protein